MTILCFEVRYIGFHQSWQRFALSGRKIQAIKEYRESVVRKNKPKPELLGVTELAHRIAGDYVYTDDHGFERVAKPLTSNQVLAEIEAYAAERVKEAWEKLMAATGHARYMINNPSAWEDGFSQSDAIESLVKAFDAALEATK